MLHGTSWINSIFDLYYLYCKCRFVTTYHTEPFTMKDSHGVYRAFDYQREQFGTIRYALVDGGKPFATHYNYFIVMLMNSMTRIRVCNTSLLYLRGIMGVSC